MSDLPPPPTLAPPPTIGIPPEADLSAPPPDMVRERPPSLPPPPDFLPELASNPDSDPIEPPEMQAPGPPQMQAPTPPQRNVAPPAAVVDDGAETPPNLPPPPSMEEIEHMNGYRSISRANTALHALQTTESTNSAGTGAHPPCTECKGTEYPVVSAVLFFLGEQNPRDVCVSCVDTMKARKSRVMEAQATLSTPLMDGWLLKRKAKGASKGIVGAGGWKQRYCVLLKGGLHYYKNENQKQEMGVLYPPNLRKVNWTPSFHTLLIELIDGTLYEFKADTAHKHSDTDIVYWYKALRRMLIPSNQAPTLFEGWLSRQKIIDNAKDAKKKRWCKLTEFSLEFYMRRDDDELKIVGEVELIGASKPDCYVDSVSGETVLVINAPRDGIFYLTLCDDSAVPLEKWQQHLEKAINAVRLK